MDYEVIDEIVVKSRMDLRGESGEDIVNMILRAIKDRVQEIEDFSTDEYYKISPATESAFLRGIFEMTRVLGENLACKEEEIEEEKE